jgi:starch synthase
VKVAILAAELAPWAKAGGLADVIAALPAAMAEAGAEPSIIVPAYRSILDAIDAPAIEGDFKVPLGSTSEPFSLRRGSLRDIPLYLIDHPGFSERPGIYGDNGLDYPDNLRRFALFGRAAASVAARIIKPDVLHAHDWHAALAPVVARADPELEIHLRDALTVFTVHNLAFQGIFEAAEYPVLSLGSSWFSAGCLEFYGRINLVQAAVALSDAVSTVSPSYAREIVQDPSLGFGLEAVFRGRGERFRGILNGADYNEWDPRQDLSIPLNFGPSDPGGKQGCTAALRAEFGLPQNVHEPLLGMVTRLTPQKGIDLVVESIGRMAALGLQLVILGSGESQWEEALRQAAGRYPDCLRLRLGYDEALAHRIQAGAEIFLMPSQFEPCGLTQMYAMRYGTIPIVRATGGLCDTVTEFNRASGEGTGFLFDDYHVETMIGVLERAVDTYHAPELWARLMQNAFAADFSWARAAREYLDWFGQLRAAKTLPQK